MMRRTPPALALATIAVAMLATGCTPTPEPTPTPTGFASEEEAFAAAEETYRAYVDALNEVDLADPATFEPMFAHLTGGALEAAKKGYSELHAKEYVSTGAAVPTVIEIGQKASLDRVTLAVCLDVSGVDMVDETGESTIDPDRPDVQSMTVALREVSGTMLIDEVSGRDGEPTCD